MANKPLMFLNISAPTAIAPPSPLNFVTALIGFIVVTPGSAGNLIFNDAATLAAANASNEICGLTYAQATGNIGVGNTLDIPVSNGLVVSSVPTGMVLAVKYSIYVPGRG